ncbi:L-threonine ammonia-lyase [Pristis pectinata]|uniref:L-threonine ammonia-lyase n=1 Tax=Pristis pectinata TaxID=685728 RepID=UPI00223D86D5|nr:L-threonine ammonia-lyase [Pristis pectinata]
MDWSGALGNRISTFKRHLGSGVERAQWSHQPVSDDSQRQRDDPIRNGYPGLRQRSINPERLKDFGEDEYLGKDVKTWEMTVTGHSETLLSTAHNVPPYKTSRSPQPGSRQAPFEDIRAAAFKIQHGIQKTPCTYSRLSKQYGIEIYLKKEYLHHTGSVKERGVCYLLASLSQEQQRKGVILASDNDFTKAVAHHATELHIPVFVILSASTPPGRVKTCREYGAMVITYGSSVKDSQSHAQKLASENGYLYLQEEDNMPYLAGLGTMGLEVYEQVNKLDAVILPAGGERHILAGAAAPIKHLNPAITVIGVEPENYPAPQQSLRKGPAPKELSYTNHRFYRELFNSTFGNNAFQMTDKLVDKIVTVKEADILLAILRLMEYERATVDAVGAIGLAAVIAGKLPELKGKRVVIALCSGNLDVPLMRQCLDRALVLDNKLCKFSIQVCDCTGDLAKVLEVLSREEVRVLDVIQERFFVTSGIFSIKVTCVIEVRDRSQMVQVERMLRERYTTFTWLERSED